MYLIMYPTNQEEREYTRFVVHVYSEYTSAALV